MPSEVWVTDPVPPEGNQIAPAGALVPDKRRAASCLRLPRARRPRCASCHGRVASMPPSVSEPISSQLHSKSVPARDTPGTSLSESNDALLCLRVPADLHGPIAALTSPGTSLLEASPQRRAGVLPPIASGGSTELACLKTGGASGSLVQFHSGESTADPKRAWPSTDPLTPVTRPAPASGASPVVFTLQPVLIDGKGWGVQGFSRGKGWSEGLRRE